MLAPAILTALAVASGGARVERPAATPDGPVREAYRLEDTVLRVAPAERASLRLATELPHRDRLLSRALAAALARDARYSDATGQVGNVDYDPFLGGQDAQAGVLADLVVDVVVQTSTRAQVRARFTNFGPRDVRFLVVVEDGRWVIDDVREGKTSLRAELARPYFCAEGWTEECVEEPGEPELPDSLEPAGVASR